PCGETPHALYLGTTRESAPGKLWGGPERSPGSESAESYRSSRDYRNWYDYNQYLGLDSAGSYYLHWDYGEDYTNYERSEEYHDVSLWSDSEVNSPEGPSMESNEPPAPKAPSEARHTTLWCLRANPNEARRRCHQCPPQRQAKQPVRFLKRLPQSRKSCHHPNRRWAIPRRPVGLQPSRRLVDRLGFLPASPDLFATCCVIMFTYLALSLYQSLSHSMSPLSPFVSVPVPVSVSVPVSVIVLVPLLLSCLRWPMSGHSDLKPRRLALVSGL
ncbi:hypothetical protein P4O66_008073, partial [Electrophorus voltai]